MFLSKVKSRHCSLWSSCIFLELLRWGKLRLLHTSKLKLWGNNIPKATVRLGTRTPEFWTRRVGWSYVRENRGPEGGAMHGGQRGSPPWSRVPSFTPTFLSQLPAVQEPAPKSDPHSLQVFLRVCNSLGNNNTLYLTFQSALITYIISSPLCKEGASFINRDPSS